MVVVVRNVPCSIDCERHKLLLSYICIFVGTYT